MKSNQPEGKKMTGAPMKGVDFPDAEKKSPCKKEDEICRDDAWESEATSTISVPWTRRGRKEIIDNKKDEGRRLASVLKIIETTQTSAGLRKLITIVGRAQHIQIR